jgi:CHAT domain-containing protein/tetratricopeptide (TPR) repeat protein
MAHSGVIGALALLCVLLPSRCVEPGRAEGAPAGRMEREEPSEFRNLRQQGNDLFRAGAYLKAVAIYEAGYQQADAQGAHKSAIRFLNNLGSAYYEMHRYRDAVRAYLDGRAAAQRDNNAEMLGAFSVNLSSLYLQLGELEAASEAARRGFEALEGRTTTFRSRLLIYAGQLKAAQGDTIAAEALLRQAIAESRRHGDAGVESMALSELGGALLAAGEKDRAAEMLEQARYLRERTGDDRLCYSYEALGRVYASQGKHDVAVEFFGRAIDSARKASVPLALWSAYYGRARSRLALERSRDAYQDLAQALEWSRRWKAEVVPADAFRLSTTVQAHQISSAFVDVANRLSAETGRMRYAAEAFGVAEEIRGAGLRELLKHGDAWLNQLPKEYWEALSRLQALEVQMMRSSSRETVEKARMLRVSMAEMEARSGIELLPPEIAAGGADLPARVQAALGPDRAYFGFQMGEERSYLYAVDREGFEMHVLPPGREIAAAIRTFSGALRSDSPEIPALGRRLHEQLLGQVSRRIRNRAHWLLGLDGALFELPFAALVEDSPAGPVHVVERHAIQVIPSALSIVRAGSENRPGGLLVGFGDPVYNRADPRWQGRARRPSGMAAMRAVLFRSSGGQAQELARLPGSGKEVQACSRSWRGDSGSLVLLGDRATKANLVAALEQQPAVLHIAAHFVMPEKTRGPAMIATSLGASGSVEYLSATEVAALRARVGLVVLNGCSSGAGSVLPAEGLLGLTRAWLAAGARGVIATRWPTVDDPGDLFQAMYSSIERRSGHGSFAQALQRAQIAQLRSGGPRARASYWSAYFCVERS